MPQNGSIRIMCPNLSCQRVLAVPEHARGKLVRCRSCGMTVRIPAAKGGSGEHVQQGGNADGEVAA